MTGPTNAERARRGLLLLRLYGDVTDGGTRRDEVPSFLTDLPRREEVDNFVLSTAHLHPADADRIEGLAVYDW